MSLHMALLWLQEMNMAHPALQNLVLLVVLLCRHCTDAAPFPHASNSTQSVAFQLDPNTPCIGPGWDAVYVSWGLP